MTHSYQRTMISSSLLIVTQLLFITHHGALFTSAFTMPSSFTSNNSFCTSSSSSSSSSTTIVTKLQMSLEPLAKEGEWTAYLDEDNTGLVYYFNTATGESSWDPPTSTFPSVKMSKWKELKMNEKRKQYNEKLENFSLNDDGSNESNTGANNNIGEMFGNFFSAPNNNEDSSYTTSTTTTTAAAATTTNTNTQVVNGNTAIEEVANDTAKEGSPILKMFGSSNTAKTESFTNGEAISNTPSSKPLPPFFNFFGQQQKQKSSTSDNVNGQSQESDVKDKPNGVNGVNGVNGSSSSTNGASTNNFFNSFFGQNPTVKRSSSDTNTENVSVEIEEEEEEFYDQMLFEDAVLVEEVPEGSTPIKLEVATKVMPHPEKVSWGGEDALFVSGKSFGVFDGVSGAEKLSGVPLYSNTLAQQLKSSIGKKGLTIDEIKAKMLKAAEYADMAATGASTAVVASIGDDDMLRAVNLGDSQLYVVRDGSIAVRAKETIHYFDCPFQLSDESPDRPRNGSVLQTPIKKGDLIIAGSDGVFDNLSDPELLEIVQNNNNGSISKLAQEIVKESRKISKDPNAATPYAKMAKRNNYAQFSRGLGGKLDDISCVVVRCK